MSDDNRTKKEIEADIALKVAEARKMEADAANAEALLRKNNIAADKAALDLKVKQMEFDSKEEKHAKENAADEENFLYRFGSEVSGGSVNSCIKKLTEWHRVNPKCDIEIIFSSPGGSIIDGFELFDHIQHLRNKGHHIILKMLRLSTQSQMSVLLAGFTILAEENDIGSPLNHVGVSF